MDWSDWGLTLSRGVVGERVDYARLIADRSSLDRFLARVARVGPESTPRFFPDRDSRLAYAINCYNATILRSVLALERDGKLPRHVPGDLESRYQFQIDGHLQTPAMLRQCALAVAGEDWRVRFVLCDGRANGPSLFRHVILGEMLDAQLDEVVRAAFRSLDVVRIDHGERKRLLLWRGLYDLRDRLVGDFEQRMQTRDATILGVLLAWSDRPRRELLNSAVGYEVALMSSSDEVNALEPTPETDEGVFSKLKSLRFIRPQ
ncbi:MAG: DUF547 domain-containing protein [Planctomycetota bacterium]